VYELLRQLFYVQINYQNGSNLEMFELLGHLSYVISSFIFICHLLYIMYFLQNLAYWSVEITSVIVLGIPLVYYFSAYIAVTTHIAEVLPFLHLSISTQVHRTQLHAHTPTSTHTTYTRTNIAHMHTHTHTHTHTRAHTHTLPTCTHTHKPHLQARRIWQYKPGGVTWCQTGHVGYPSEITF
jgi:hypothetical protein